MKGIKRIVWTRGVLYFSDKKMSNLESVAVSEKIMEESSSHINGPIIENVTVLDNPVDNTVGSESQLSLTKQQDDESQQSLLKQQNDEAILVVAGTKRRLEESDELSTNISSSSSKSNEPNQKNPKLPIWYDALSVNAIEVKNMPEFFSIESKISKGAEEYMRMRDFIISLYEQNLSVYLSATDCRRKLVGDVCAVLKIHSFLDAFGVINFDVKANCRPSLTHASLSHWHQDSTTSPSSSTSVDVDNLLENFPVEWSENMDRSLRSCAVTHLGDWVSVASTLVAEFGSCAADGEDLWQPSPEDCLARFVSLPFGININGHSADSSSANGKDNQQVEFLSSQIAGRAATALGCDAAQKIFSSVFGSLSSEVRKISWNALTFAMFLNFILLS